MNGVFCHTTYTYCKANSKRTTLKRPFFERLDIRHTINDIIMITMQYRAARVELSPAQAWTSIVLVRG
jgi:hypothetical protein